jgi:D-tyrosyl-tRNA(Tyr) deacylase
MCTPRGAKEQVSTEYWGSLRDETCNTQKPAHSRIWVRKNCEGTKTYTTTITRRVSEAKKRSLGVHPRENPGYAYGLSGMFFSENICIKEPVSGKTLEANVSRNITGILSSGIVYFLWK